MGRTDTGAAASPPQRSAISILGSDAGTRALLGMGHNHPPFAGSLPEGASTPLVPAWGLILPAPLLREKAHLFPGALVLHLQADPQLRANTCPPLDDQSPGPQAQ